MAETKKFVVVDGPINHDQELYQNGDPIELAAKAAARLQREKKVAPWKAKKGEDESRGKDTQGEDDQSQAAGEGDKGKGNTEGTVSEDKLKEKSKGGKK